MDYFNEPATVPKARIPCQFEKLMGRPIMAIEDGRHCAGRLTGENSLCMGPAVIQHSLKLATIRLTNMVRYFLAAGCTGDICPKAE